MKLIFATNNDHKVKEIRYAIGDRFELLTLKEAGIFQDIPEPHATLEDNATEKSTTIYNLTGTSCFSEDSGLETDALDGEPGVRSARYAGDGRSSDDNMDLLLDNLHGISNRRARFRTVISLIIDGNEHLFEGVCEGRIAGSRQGEGGFGYDPVFIPEGSDRSFGEMTLSEKDRYSHRAKATAKLVAFLNNLQPKPGI
ncbi:MAG: RdgB/HAM1 family non-canonical purine NTP pyrophosphatase [Chitinophagaceae bacterium]|nr:MAG: RdgB/HAM1 family non-canonical purine NTP pyrophosphatase [Chitinophagaceae bacterium]